MNDEMSTLKPGICIKPNVTVDEVKEVVLKLYGLTCKTVSELNGYDDKNYRIVVEEFFENEHLERICLHGYVLKIMNSLDSKKIDFIEAQNSLMLFLAKNNINCPKPIQTKDERYYTIKKFVSGKHAVRLLEFIPGSILYQVPTSPKLFYEAGKFISRVDDVLKEFHHSAYDSHETLWTLDSVPKLRQFLFVIKDGVKRKLFEEIIRQFEDRVLKVRNNLESGMIHGDFNEQNIVVDKIDNDKQWSIVSVLDFGDTQFSCYLYELAITMTYMMILGKSIDVGGYVIAGYSTIRQIPETELKLLKICISARLCQSLVMGAYSSLQDPDNTYLLVTATPGWKLLSELWKETEENLLMRWKKTAECYGDCIFSSSVQNS